MEGLRTPAGDLQTHALDEHHPAPVNAHGGTRGRGHGSRRAGRDGRPGLGRRRPAPARVGRQRRRMAGPQLQPREHPGHDADADQLQDGVAAEGQVEVRLQGRWRLRRLLLDADQPQRHGLPPGPQLQRLRARPHDRPRRVAAQVQQAERRAQRRRVRGRPHLRRDLVRRLRTRREDGQDAVDTHVDSQHARGRRHDAAGLRRHRAAEHRPREHLELLRRQRRRHRLGARRGDRPAQVEVQHHLRRRQALRPPEDQQRRRSLVPAVGRQPGSRLHLRRESGAAVRDEEVPQRLEPPRSATSTPTRSSPSTARPAGGCGSSRRFATTSATTT